ncbi:MAG: hypothetical protein RL508_273 [Actinomycetota bacterium]|jgi:predicted 3-demethylubiquinone-9 3-methyltransferase (glyoxalase superfamily)
MTSTPSVKTCFWYPQNLGSALARYSEIFGENFKLANPNLPLGDNSIMDAEFSIFDYQLRGMGFPGGEELNYSSSLMLSVDGQEEVDYYWNALLADGGRESQCGWLYDAFGLSWQIVPKQLMECLSNPDTVAAQFAMQAMLGMKKIVIAELVKGA